MATIILTGGGTAGHCAPNMALVPHLKKVFNNIYYIGSQNGIEKTLCEKEGLEYYSIPTAKLNRSFTFKNFSIPFKVISGYLKAKDLIEKLKPDVIFSKGGYVALPVVLAAHSKKVPVVSHESDYTMGLANSFTAKYCDKILTTFKETAEKNKKCVFVGSPLKEQLLKSPNKKKILESFNLSGKKPVITITGGSQGAKAINDCVRSSLDSLLDKFDIIHACGKGNLKKINKEGYYQAEYIYNLEDAFKISSVCVSRAGSNTLLELMHLKVPTIAIPLPKGNSRGDQVFNAEYFNKKGLLYLLPQADLTPKSLEFAINCSYANRYNLAREFTNHDFSDACPKIIDILKRYVPKE